MPRMDAPPPSSEYTVVLEQPFNKHDIAPSKRIEIIGEPNRSASIKVTERTGENLENIIEHEGSIDRSDTQELMGMLNSIRGLPTNPDNDIYGLNTRLMFTDDLSLMEDMVWDNASDVSYGEATDEVRDQFERTVASIEALARMKARMPARV